MFYSGKSGLVGRRDQEEMRKAIISLILFALIMVGTAIFFTWGGVVTAIAGIALCAGGLIESWKQSWE